ncbi:nucleoside-diphosphate kinase [PVC group bacterium (ex Bugula neritina AB1)]|nr:nucleoside-diphosphate kinase [PVC group bacterium (ex Bugula neritina AB1)]
MTEKTLVILKPDAVKRALTGEIISRFEKKGLKILALKMTSLDDDILSKHYSEHVNKFFYEGLCRFMKDGPVLLILLEGYEAISVVRKMMGQTNASKADSGTIRGDFALTQGFNLVHGSDSKEAADREIALFFKDHDIHHYQLDSEKWNLPND